MITLTFNNFSTLLNYLLAVHKSLLMLRRLSGQLSRMDAISSDQVITAFRRFRMLFRRSMWLNALCQRLQSGLPSFAPPSKVAHADAD